MVPIFIIPKSVQIKDNGIIAANLEALDSAFDQRQRSILEILTGSLALTSKHAHMGGVVENM